MIPQPNNNDRLPDESLRKAAILVASLDLPAADALLDGLQPEQAAAERFDRLYDHDPLNFSEGNSVGNASPA